MFWYKWPGTYDGCDCRSADSTKVGFNTAKIDKNVTIGVCTAN